MNRIVLVFKGTQKDYSNIDCVDAQSGSAPFGVVWHDPEGEKGRELEKRWNEHDELAADAKRYRWLRDHCTPEENPSHTWIVEAPGDEWDKAIDEAMAGGAEK